MCVDDNGSQSKSCVHEASEKDVDEDEDEVDEDEDGELLHMSANFPYMGIGLGVLHWGDIKVLCLLAPDSRLNRPRLSPFPPTLLSSLLPPTRRPYPAAFHQYVG